MSKKNPVVALLTDFGTRDYYVAALKAAILKISPSVQIVDISHDVPPQDVRWGAFQLFSVFRDFPKGTLFLAVVDPGVGTRRNILFAEAAGYRFIGPDNGLLSLVFAAEKPRKVLALTKLKDLNHVSKTFHGRDVMAPVAARILKGENPLKFGNPLKKWVVLPQLVIKKIGAKWSGEIIAIDHFGNLVTSFKAGEVTPLAKGSRLWFDLGRNRGTIRGLAKSYSESPEGGLLAIEGSHGFVEIAVRNGSAAEKTGLKAGNTVTLFFRT